MAGFGDLLRVLLEQGLSPAAQLYTASLFAIEVDTPQEVEYLGRLAAGLGLGLQTGVVEEIHRSLGVNL
ncbi:MAG: DUF533 domain-containing protein [Gammaproteobacteria bacterium]|jgi:uncharacterized membrane protein YebE (DUF533 family)